MGQVQGTGRTVERGEGALKPEQLSVQRAQREERRHTGWPPTGAISHLDFQGSKKSSLGRFSEVLGK